MNNWQAIQQVKFLLLERKWPGSSNRVFGNGAVRITRGPTESGLAKMRLPFALITAGLGNNDPIHSDLIVQNFNVVLVSANAGDDVGERSLIGANRQGPTLTAGRGLLELEEQVIDTLSLVESKDGLNIVLIGQSANEAVEVDGLGYICKREYVFQATIATSRFYHPPRKFAGSAAGGTASLSWDLPPNRWDRNEILLRVASGSSTPPSGPTAGVKVALASGVLSRTASFTPASGGTYSFSVFAGYDEDGDSDNEAFSEDSAATGLTFTI